MADSVKLPPPPSPTGSRIKVECGYCGKEMERRNIKSHTLSVHTGRTPLEKAPKGQQKIGFLKREASTGNHFEDAKKKKDDEPFTLDENTEDDVDVPEIKLDPDNIIKEVINSRGIVLDARAWQIWIL